MEAYSDEESDSETQLNRALSRKKLNHIKKKKKKAEAHERKWSSSKPSRHVKDLREIINSQKKQHSGKKGKVEKGKFYK